MKYSTPKMCIRDRFVQKLKEKLKVVYRDGEVKIGLNGKLKVPAACNSEKNRLKIYITSPCLLYTSEL